MGGQIPASKARPEPPQCAPWGGVVDAHSPGAPRLNTEDQGYLGSSQRLRGRASEAMGLEVFLLLLEAWGKGLRSAARREGR